MHLKQVTTGLAILLLYAATGATAAPAKEQTPAEKGTANDGAQIIIRSEADKKRRQQEEAAHALNLNSNRQSDANSNRGLERAAERHPARAGKQPEEPWLESIFGQREKSGDKPDKKNDEPRWWWPFD